MGNWNILGKLKLLEKWRIGHFRKNEKMENRMVPYGTWWYHMDLMVPCYGTLWYHTVPYGNHMVPYGTIWYLMVPYGTIWYHMVPYGTIVFKKNSKNIFREIFLNIFSPGGCRTPRCLKSLRSPHPQSPDDPPPSRKKTFSREPYGTIWYHKVPYGTIRYYMVPYGTIWYHIVP